MASPLPPGTSPPRPKLGEFLMRAGFINADQLRHAFQEQKATNHSLGRVLVDLGYITEQIRIQALRQAYRYELLDLSQVKVDPFVATLIPHGTAEAQRIFPLRREKDKLFVAMEDPSDEVTIESLRLQVGVEIKPYIITRQELDILLNAGQGKPGKLVIETPRGKSRKQKFFHRWTFRLLVLLPLLIFLALIKYNEEFQDLLMNSGAEFFDLGMYVALGLGLWAVVVYEITGLIFKTDEDDE